MGCISSSGKQRTCFKKDESQFQVTTQVQQPEISTTGRQLNAEITTPENKGFILASDSNSGNNLGKTKQLLEINKDPQDNYQSA